MAAAYNTITISEASRYGMNSGAATEYRVVIEGRITVNTTVTTSPRVADAWIRYVRPMFNFHNPNFRLISGLDIEVVGQPPRTATVVICVAEECLIYHMYWAVNGLPLPLQQFLLDHRNIFVGVSVQPNLEILSQEARFEGQVPYVELSQIAGNYGAAVTRSWSRWREDTIRYWDVPEHSQQDVWYACTLANICRRIGLQRRRNIIRN